MESTKTTTTTMSPASRAAALKREKKAAAIAARIAGKAAAAKKREDDEAAFLEAVRLGRENIEKKIDRVCRVIGILKNERDTDSVCQMKANMEFDLMCALRKQFYGK